MCKIKTLSGKGLRDEFTAFEIEVLKYAVENNIAEGKTFSYKTEQNGFTVQENSTGLISVLRLANGKTLTAVKVETRSTEGEEVTRPQRAAAAVTAPKVENVEAQTLLNQFAALLNQPKAAQMDESQINAIVDACVSARVADIEAAHTTKISINSVEIKALEGQILHDAFEDILTAVTDGDIPYLFGPAGTGKTTAAKQVAEALGLPFYCVGALQSKYEMEGFRDATGAYQDTVLYKAMTNGGVFLFDEIDSTSAEVLIPFNSIMANGYYTFPNGEKVTAHKDFHIICAGNTCGRGADEAYNGRFQLDASTLDRFGFIEMTYSRAIDLKNANGDAELVDMFEELRKVIKTQGLTYTATPRALERTSKKILHNWSFEKSLRYGLCSGWDKDDIKLIQNGLTCSNKWGKVFKAL